MSPLSFNRLLAGGTAAVVLLWAFQVHASAGLAAVLATAAHLAGLLGGYGILVMLLLMARVPAVEHGVGADRLTVWHAHCGRYVVGAVSAHVTLALAGYAAHTGKDVVTAWAELLGYPALAAAAAGAVAMLAAWASSAGPLRKRMKHETWRAIHLLTYAAAVGGFVHQMAGPDINASRLIAWTWAMLHTTVAALLIWYRCVVPARRALRHRLRVHLVRREAPGVVSVLIRGSDLEALRAEPGQFFRWRFLTRRLWRTALPFSLSAPAHAGELRITVKTVGDHTRRISRLRPGIRVVATGPFGAMTARRRTRDKVLLIAGGVGITPLRALFETLPAQSGQLTLLYRAANEDQLILRTELEAIAARREARIHYLLGSSDAAYSPLAPQALLELVPELTSHDVYICGPPQMTALTVAALRRVGVPQQHIHTENFTY